MKYLYFDTHKELMEHLWEEEKDDDGITKSQIMKMSVNQLVSLIKSEELDIYSHNLSLRNLRNAVISEIWDDGDEDGDWDDDEDGDWDDDDEEDDDDDEEDDDDAFLLGVRFTGPNSKVYNYLSNNTKLKRGDCVTIKTRTSNVNSEVEVVGYTKFNRDMNYRQINIIDHYRPKQAKVKTSARDNKFIKKEKITMKTKKAINVAKISLNDTKDIAVKMVKGQSIITAIKTTLLEMDTIPDAAKVFLNIPGYSDLAIGFILNMAGQTFTESEVIEDAADAANFVGSVEFAKQFTIIQDLIESTIKSAMGGKAKAEKVVGEVLQKKSEGTKK